MMAFDQTQKQARRFRGGGRNSQKYASGGVKSKEPTNKNGTCLLFIINTNKITFLSRQTFSAQNFELHIKALGPRFYNNNHSMSSHYHSGNISQNIYLCTSQTHHCDCMFASKANKV